MCVGELHDDNVDRGNRIVEPVERELLETEHVAEGHRETLEQVPVD